MKWKMFYNKAITLEWTQFVSKQDKPRNSAICQTHLSEHSIDVRPAGISTNKKVLLQANS